MEAEGLGDRLTAGGASAPSPSDSPGVRHRREGCRWRLPRGDTTTRTRGSGDVANLLPKLKPQL